MSERAQTAQVPAAPGPRVVAAVSEYLELARSDSAAAQAHLLGLGAVAELEAKLRRYYDVRHALAVSSATSGLHAVAIALDLKNADIITSPLSWGGSLAGFLHVGARPLFTDVEESTLTLCPESARAAVRSTTKAILAVDLFGVPADDAALRRVADEHGLWYVHDGAQSLGATRDGRPAGSRAHVTVISFTIGKTVFAGEGGAILTDDDDLYARLLWLTQHPYRQRRELGLSVFNEFALNARMHPVAAVWAAADFEGSLRRLEVHQDRMDTLVKALDASGMTEPLEFAANRIRPTHTRVTAAWRGRPRPSKLVAALRSRGERVKVLPAHFPLVYHQAAFRAQYTPAFRPRCPVAETQARNRCEVLEQ